VHVLTPCAAQPGAHCGGATAEPGCDGPKAMPGRFGDQGRADDLGRVTAPW
jgi:hypothetical protein